MLTSLPVFRKVAITNPGSSLAFHDIDGTMISRVLSKWTWSENVHLWALKTILQTMRSMSKDL